MLRGRCPADDRLDEARAAVSLPPTPATPTHVWRNPHDIHACHPRPRPRLTAGGTDELREVIAGNLLTARERTRLLTESVDDTDLVRQHSPLMSPLVWDLAHIANQEELWLLRDVGGREPMHPEIDPLYDAFEHPRSERPTLPLLPPAEARGYAHEVRGRVMDLLESARFTGDPLVTERVRVRHGRPARAAARRDHAGHPPAAGRAAGAVRAPAAARRPPTR